MIQIRRGVFETNSSSTHCLVIWPKADYDKAQNMNLYICNGGSFEPEMYTREEAIEIAKAEFVKYNRDCLCPTDIDDEFIEGWAELVPFSKFGKGYSDIYESFTSPNGDKMVAFGYYGWDG